VINPNRRILVYLRICILSNNAEVGLSRRTLLSKQLLRSGTAIGALVREAEHAESKADFIHKLAIAQKEANESDYWIELLYQSEYLSREQFLSLKKDIEELNKILASIIITTKRNLK